MMFFFKAHNQDWRRIRDESYHTTPLLGGNAYGDQCVYKRRCNIGLNLSVEMLLKVNKYKKKNK